jgi:hypothetical protein
MRQRFSGGRLIGRSASVVVAVCLAWCATTAAAAAGAESNERASADFQLQGEYVGDAGGGGHKLGAQVVALGDEKFQAALLPGGLPGEGWDGKTRAEMKGQRKGRQVALSGDGYQAAVDGETLAGTGAGGQKFTLKKVHRESPARGAKPPAGATVLFAKGGNTNAWQDAKLSGEGYLLAGATTKQPVKDFTMHVEFRIPFRPASTDQARGNSGVYIQRRYEVQILDSFGLPAVFNGCGSLYRQRTPDLNMTYPPGAWQTYDIDFTAAKWDGTKKTKNAVITVKQNGVTIHDHVEITAKTGAGQAEGPEPLPIWLQEHGSPVEYDNIWIVEKKGAGK